MKRYRIEYYSRSNTGAWHWEIENEILKKLCEDVEQVITAKELAKAIDDFKKSNNKDGWKWNDRELKFENHHIAEGASYGYQEISFTEIDETKTLSKFSQIVTNFFKNHQKIEVICEDEDILNVIKESLEDNDKIQYYYEDDTFVLEIKDDNIEDTVYQLLENILIEYLNGGEIDYKYAGYVDMGMRAHASQNPYATIKMGWEYDIKQDEIVLSSASYWIDGGAPVQCHMEVIFRRYEE